MPSGIFFLETELMENSQYEIKKTLSEAIFLRSCYQEATH